MWAVGVIELGLSDDAFWNLTPKLFALLCAQASARERREDRRAGEVVAMLYNLKRDTKKDPKGISWDDVFPDSTRQEPQTEEEMLMAMNAWAKRSGGMAN